MIAAHFLKEFFKNLYYRSMKLSNTFSKQSVFATSLTQSFIILLAQWLHELYLGSLESTLASLRRYYFLSGLKGRIRKVFNHKITVTNSDHLFKR